MAVLIPEKGCFSISGNKGRLFVALNSDPLTPGTGGVVYARVGSLDSYTVSFPESRRDDNRDGWIRNIKSETGMTVAASGDFDPDDLGQRKVNELAAHTDCDSMGWFRFFKLGKHEESDHAEDFGFWASPTRGDQSGSNTDAFTWSVTLPVYNPPGGLDMSGEPVPPDVPETIPAGAFVESPLVMGSPIPHAATRTPATPASGGSAHKAA